MSDHNLKCYQAACDEIAELKEKLRVAVEALTVIAADFGTDYCGGETIIAREALDKIKGGSE